MSISSIFQINFLHKQCPMRLLYFIGLEMQLRGLDNLQTTTLDHYLAQKVGFTFQRNGFRKGNTYYNVPSYQVKWKSFLMLLRFTFVAFCHRLCPCLSFNSLEGVLFRPNIFFQAQRKQLERFFFFSNIH